MAGLAEEPDSELFEKQRAFAIAARTYAAFYTDPKNRKFPGKPYDGSDDPAIFQAYGGIAFEEQNPKVGRGRGRNGRADPCEERGDHQGALLLRRRRSHALPAEAGWVDFPFPEIFSSKPDPWCEGTALGGTASGCRGAGPRGKRWKERPRRKF